jgi:hypothetical protein
VLNIYVLLFPFFQRSFGFLFSLPAFSKLIVSYGDAKVRAFIQIIKNFLPFFEVFFFRKQLSVFRRTCNFLERTAKIQRVFKPSKFSSLFSKLSSLLFSSFSYPKPCRCKQRTAPKFAETLTTSISYSLLSHYSPTPLFQIGLQR